MKKILFLIIISVFSIISYSNYVKDFPTTFKQPDGTIVNCLITGDEFFRRLHDENGYTFIEDPTDGFLVYAKLENDNLISSGYRYGTINPEIVGIQPNIMISREKYLAIREDFFSKELPKPKSDNILKSGQNNGTINNIVIYVRFSDQTEFSVTSTTIENLFNSSASNTSSMYNFFRAISNNQTTIISHFYPTNTGTTILSYQDSHPRNYYRPYSTNNTIGYQEADRATREHQLLTDAVNAVKSEIPISLNLDFDNNGYVDNVCFIVRGADTGYSGLLWPHKWSLFSQNVSINGKRIETYNLQLETHVQDASTLCHEMYHTLGAPDLYHDSGNLTPVDKWDVMAQNLNPPQSSSAYVKYKYGGWIPEIPEITQGGHYTINDVFSATNNCYKIASPLSGATSGSEFFMVEYRNKLNFWETGLPGSGLIIYKINPPYNGNHNGPPDGIYVYRPGASNANTNGQINNAYFSSGSGRTEFSNSTNPPCFLNNGSLENFRIYNISSSGGATMSFDIEFNQHYFNILGENINFGEVSIDTSKTMYSSVSALYLDNTITWVKGGVDTNFFTVTQESWDNYLGGYLKINFNPDEVRTYNAYIDVSTPEFPTKRIDISGNGMIIPVVADFNSSAHSIWEGEEIEFSDLSTGTPISWEWTFEGGTPTNSIEQNPTITYNSEGLYSVTLSVQNLHTNDVMTKIQYINVVNPESESFCNNKFEYWTNGSPDCWKGSKNNVSASRYSDAPYEGNYSASISNVFTAKKRFTSKGFNISPDYKYDIHFYYKGKGNLMVSLYDERTENNGFSSEEDTIYVNTENWLEITKSIQAIHTSNDGQISFAVSKTEAIFKNIIIDDVTITPIYNPISVNSNTIDNFSIFPNPSTENINVKVTENSIISVYDITGKLISTANVSSGEIYTFSQTAGMYFVNVNGKVQKVVFE